MSASRFRHPLLRRGLVFSITTALLLSLALAYPGQALPGSAFESDDGNLTSTPPATDWETAPNRVVKLDKTPAASDDSFGQGAKEDIPNPTEVTGSIPPNKSDLTRFYVSHERTADGNIFLYLAWERSNVLGSANMDFEFNQSQTLATNKSTPLRTAGDMLITFDFVNGGGTPVLGLLRWVTSGATSQCFSSNSLPCWGKRVNLSAAGFADGAVNATSVTDPIPPNDPRTLAAGTFGEAGINLSAAGLFPPGQCVSFASAFLKSRSSASFTAELKDFIAPANASVSNCGRIVVKKVTDPNPDPSGTSFPFTLTGGPSNLNKSFSLNNGGAEETLVLAGSGYSAAEATPAGWDLTGATCDDNSPVGNIEVSPDETVTCTFTNTQRGRIVVKKVTDPNPDPSGTSFPFTLTGGPSNLNQSFGLNNGQAHDSGPLLPGSGYSAAEATPAGWDLTGATCDDNSPVGNIGVSTGETVTCTFTNRARATINLHKQDDAGNPLAGAVFTLFTDNPPLDGPPPHGSEDASTGKTCTTDSTGNCSIDQVVPGEYWVVETTGVPGHDTAADQHVTVGGGQIVLLTFVDPRQFRVIVVVCQEGSDQLHPSTVTVDGVDKTSLGPNGGGALTDAQVCALGGARYEGKHVGNHPANVNIPSSP